MRILERFWRHRSAAFTDFLGRRSKWEIRIACLILTLGIIYGDYILAARVTLAIFYAIPIAIVTWYVSAASGFTLAVIAVCLLEWVDYLVTDMSAPWVPTVNGIFRVIFYVFFVLVLVRLRNLQRNLRTLAEDRAYALAREAARSVRLEREMLEAGEREQRRIGQDLHDGLCQHLTGTALASQVLVENLKGPVQADARKIVELIEEGITLTRDIAKGLYPLEMQNDGLMQALEKFAVNTTDLFGIDCRFECNLPVLIDVPSTAAHLYRIAQEAVSNAVRHGGATRIDILLEESDSGVRLSISDNGSGLPDPLPHHDGMGLRNMADRTNSIGGKISFQPGALGGAQVICVAPARWIT